MIRPRSRATHYDGVHAGYEYLQLHYQAPSGDTRRKIRHAETLSVSVMTAAELRFGALAPPRTLTDVSRDLKNSRGRPR